jgi:hypothetical protein
MTLPKPTAAMLEHFKARTKEHIDRVKKCLLRLEEASGLSGEQLSRRGSTHDADKYSREFVLPYVWVTEYYRVKNSGEKISDKLKEIYAATREVTGQHVTRNRHHPEYHDDPQRHEQAGRRRNGR